jgi:general secretion pathway protein H
MRTSAAGNKRTGGRIARHGRRKARAFTLIELLVVVAIIAIATAGVSFALRDTQATQLEREAQRLAALFESARAQSRASGVPVRWRVVEGGFRFDGAQPGTLPEQWLSPSTQVNGNAQLVLGPEPIIGPQEVVIASTGAPDRQLRIATDGLRPFRVSAAGS